MIPVWVIQHTGLEAVVVSTILADTVVVSPDLRIVNQVVVSAIRGL
jgi:hypothetical protein